MLRQKHIQFGRFTRSSIQSLKYTSPSSTPICAADYSLQTGPYRSVSCQYGSCRFVSCRSVQAPTRSILLPVIDVLSVLLLGLFRCARRSRFKRRYMRAKRPLNWQLSVQWVTLLQTVTYGVLSVPLVAKADAEESNVDKNCCMFELIAVSASSVHLIAFSNVKQALSISQERERSFPKIFTIINGSY